MLNVWPLLYHQLKGWIYCNEVAVDQSRRDSSVVKSACYTISRSSHRKSEHSPRHACDPVTEGNISKWVTVACLCWAYLNSRFSERSKRKGKSDRHSYCKSLNTVFWNPYIQACTFTNMYTNSYTAQHPKYIHKEKWSWKNTHKI